MSNFDLAWFGEDVKRKMSNTEKDALLKIANDLQQRSSEEAPIDKGDLRGNAGIDDTNINKGEVLVGFSLPYALVQHEMLDYNHPQGGKAKYLEDPLNANSRNYIRFFGKAIQKDFRP